MNTSFTIAVLAVVVAAGPLLAAAKKPAKGKEKPEVQDPKALLAKFDEDKDGKIDGKELSKLLKSLKHNVVSAKLGLPKYDADKDGKLDLSELTKLLGENK